MLCAQFLRDNIDIPILKDVQPQDISDVTERYRAYLGIHFEADTVKKVKLHGTEAPELFLVSLIEHKGTVDYNIAIQLFRYMVLSVYMGTHASNRDICPVFCVVLNRRAVRHVSFVRLENRTNLYGRGRKVGNFMDGNFCLHSRNDLLDRHRKMGRGIYDKSRGYAGADAPYDAEADIH